MDTLSWTIETEPNPADVEFLEHRINEYNFATTGITDGQTLALFERDAEGQILAGLYGWTRGGTCEVRFLWVAGDSRGKGPRENLACSRRGRSNAPWLQTDRAEYAQLPGARVL